MEIDAVVVMFRCLCNITVLAPGMFCEKCAIQLFFLHPEVRFCTLCKSIMVTTLLAQSCNTDAAPSAFAGGVPSCVPSCSSGQVRLRIAATSSTQMVSVVEGEQKPVRKRMRMCEEDGETKDKIEPRMGKPAVNDKHLLKRDGGVIHGSLGTFQLSRRQRMCTRRDCNFNPNLLPRCQLRRKVDPCLAGDLAKLEVPTAM